MHPTTLVNIKSPTIPGKLVAFTDLSVKVLHRQVSVGKVNASGILGDVLLNTLAGNARSVGSISAHGAVFPFSSPSPMYIMHILG